MRTKTIVTYTCLQCGDQFSRQLNHRKNAEPIYCSRKCRDLSFWRQVTLSCAACGRVFTRSQAQVNAVRNFCSSSCSATYNNTHKTTGTRRSKLEAFLEQQLRSEFPQLELICNKKDAIGSELDFYFPQLRLAIELNGIFHYEPIYGTNKLEQIQRNDQQKYANCLAAGIELCVIDSSSVIHLTSVVKERYWLIVKNLVIPLLGRAGDTNVQVP